MLNWFKTIWNYDEINNNESFNYFDDYNKGIIPDIIFKYFPIPETIILQEEFNFIINELRKTYGKSFGVNYIFNEFIVYYTQTDFIDFIYADEKEILEVVNFIK